MKVICSPSGAQTWRERGASRASLNLLAAQLAKDFPNENEGLGIQVIPPGFVVPQFRNAMLRVSAALMGLVALVLLIACANLANLLLARATERGKEIAIRLSIGASRARIVRQLLTESVMLAVAGGLAGVALARWIIDSIMALKPPIAIPITLELHLDWRVLVFSMIVSVITGVLFGLVPALQATKPDLIPALKDAASQSGARRSLLRNGLVVAQIAVSLLLLIAAGLTLRALQQLRVMNPGFNPEILMMNFDLRLQGSDRRRRAASQTIAQSRRVAARRAIGLDHRFIRQHELQRHCDSDRRPAGSAASTRRRRCRPASG